MMVSALFYVYGSRGSAGTISLSSNAFRGSVDFIRVPKGIKLKIWKIELSSKSEARVTVEVTNDVTVSNPSWSSVRTVYLASPGEVSLEFRRPIIIEGRTGREAVRVVQNEPLAGTTYLTMLVEITDE